MSQLNDGRVAAPGTIYWNAIEPFWDRLSRFEQYPASCIGIPTWIVLLHAAHWVQSEVCNGGFAQLFDNSTGVLVPEGIRGFQDLGMTKTAMLVGRASEEMGAPYPRDRGERQRRLMELEPKLFETTEDEFFELIETEQEGFVIAADHYAARMQE